VKIVAILMFEKMDKIWSTVIWCLEDKKLNEIAKKIIFERRR
jgi:hypothetical protein